MQEGTILNLHIARVKGTPSDPVQEATAISAHGLEGDRSCLVNNARQVLVMDQETLDEFELAPGQVKENITTTGLDLSQTQPGQVFFIGSEGSEVTMEIVGECEPCGKMDAIRMGLRERLNHRRGMLAMVISGGTIKVGDPIRIEP
jgi:MOSC domain-containing protein YiiM